MSADELRATQDDLQKLYEGLLSAGLKLDLTRGKPAPEQLDLSNELLSLPGLGDYRDASGTDCRNYGGLQGLSSRRSRATAEELLAGGSIFWVFKGVMLARQRIMGLDEHFRDDGIRRCALILDRDVIRVSAVPRRAFQGWRYLTPPDAPPDLPAGRAAESPLPPKLARELAEMGLL